VATLLPMPMPESFEGLAFNPVPESENRIHSDEVARAYGFRGGLVPGVVVSAYLLHPAAVAWGRDWLERGQAHAVVHSPVYHGERFRVEVDVERARVFHLGVPLHVPVFRWDGVHVQHRHECWFVLRNNLVPVRRQGFAPRVFLPGTTMPEIRCH